jgi:hypothetical protein
MSVASFGGRLLIPVAVYGAFALARKYIPARANDQSSDHSSVDYSYESFSGTQWTVGIATAFAVAGFAFLTHAMLVYLSRWYAALDGLASFRLFPQTAIWWFFPGFGALTVGYEIVLQLWSLFGDAGRAARYSRWSNLKAGFDGRRLLRWMALLIATPIGIFTLLEIPAHVSLADQVIIDHGYGFGKPKIYRYDAARKLTIIEGFRVKDGSLTSRAGIVIDFDGGRRWSSANSGDFKKEVDPALLEFLIQKTKLLPEHTETADDIR